MEKIKTPLYKRKILVIPMLGLMLIALVSAAVLFETSHATVTVSEALSVAIVTVTPTGYAGDTISENITINSLSTGSIPITLEWVNGTNTDLVEFTYTGPVSDTLVTGDNIITLTWDISTGSPNGEFEGDITLIRE